MVGSLFGCLDSVSFLELIDTTTGVYKLLLAGEERMTLAANIDFHNVAVFGRTGLKGLAASTYYCNFMVLGMDISLHFFYLTICYH